MSGFPRQIGPVIIQSVEHLVQFGDRIKWRKAKLVKRKTKVGNEIHDHVPLGKIYEVGPAAFHVEFNEEAYCTKDGWLPVELLELVD